MGMPGQAVGQGGQHVLAHVPGHLRQGDHAQGDQHQRDGELGHQGELRRDRDIEQDDRTAHQEHGEGMPHAPQRPDAGCTGQVALARDDGGHRHHVVRVGGMQHPEQEPQDYHRQGLHALLDPTFVNFVGSYAETRAGVKDSSPSRYRSRRGAEAQSLAERSKHATRSPASWCADWSAVLVPRQNVRSLRSARHASAVRRTP